MSNNHAKPNKFVEFLNGKGFYIILIICVAAVGIAGYALFFSGGNEKPDDLMSVPSQNPIVAAPSITPVPTAKPSSEPITTAVPSGALNSGEVVMSTPSAKPLPASKETNPPDNATQVAGDADLNPPKRPTASFYVWPLGGEVMVPFSVDELVFSNTMEDWRVHTGADIAGSLGALVSAIGDGVVEDVYDDEMMGKTVVIDHGGSTYSVYKNLAETVKVTAGDKVEAGQTIGAIGASADAESADTPHLHLEVIKAGAQIDPLTLLP